MPVNPPRELVTLGPYAWTRNPMVIAAFAWLSGLEFLLNSISMVFVWTPVFILVNVIELKLPVASGARSLSARRYVPVARQA